MGDRGPRVHDKDVLDALEDFGAQPFDALVWHVTRSGRDPARGSAANGRWSPPGEFEVLYTSLERDGALAEIGHRLSLEPVWPSRLVHELHTLTVHTERAVRLPNLPSLQTLGVNTARYEKYDYSATQAIAAAAQFLGFDALIVPNARHPGLNLVGLFENLDPGAAVAIVPSEIVDWSDWRRRGQGQLRATSSSKKVRQGKARPPRRAHRRGPRTRKGARWEDGGKPKLTPHQRAEAIRRKESGEGVREIARSCNVHNSTISRLGA